MIPRHALAALTFCGLLGCHGVEGSPGHGVIDGDRSNARGAGSTGCAAEASGSRDTHVSASDCGSDSLVVSTVRIHDIQGEGFRSPFEGDLVSGVMGVVTAVMQAGFYFQSADEDVDGDDATSEGLFVYVGDAPSVVVRDRVVVAGRVSEYRPGCVACDQASSAYANLSTTELEEPASIEVLAAGAGLPSAARLGPGGREVPTVVSRPVFSGDVEAVGTALEPEADALGFYESLEGMLVEVPQPVAVGPTTDTGELPVLANGQVSAGLRTARGGMAPSPDDANPKPLLLVNPEMPRLDVGDSFSGSVKAIVDYQYGTFRLVVQGPLPPSVDGGLRRELTTLGAPTSGELTTATFNLENLDPGDGPGRFAELAAVIVDHLGAPDLLALAELQDDSGPTDDGTVSAETTVSLLEEALVTAGGPPYAHSSIDPIDGADGGEPGGNIRVVILYRTDRGLALVERGGAGAHTPNEVVSRAGLALLRYSPGLLAPSDAAFEHSRKALAAEFRLGGETVFVVATHLCSKVADEPLLGRFQPPQEESAVQRLAQASVIADFVARLTAVEPAARVLVMGDMNDTEHSAALAALEAVRMSPLVRRLPPGQRYTYLYRGNSQAFDHILVSPALFDRATGVDIVHVGAEFSERASDHDPMVARFAWSD